MSASISGTAYHLPLLHQNYNPNEDHNTHKQRTLVPALQIFHSSPFRVLRATERRGREFTRGHLCLK